MRRSLSWFPTRTVEYRLKTGGRRPGRRPLQSFRWEGMSAWAEAVVEGLESKERLGKCLGGKLIGQVSRGGKEGSQIREGGLLGFWLKRLNRWWINQDCLFRKRKQCIREDEETSLDMLWLACRAYRWKGLWWNHKTGAWDRHVDWR